MFTSNGFLYTPLLSSHRHFCKSPSDNRYHSSGLSSRNAGTRSSSPGPPRTPDMDIQIKYFYIIAITLNCLFSLAIARHFRLSSAMSFLSSRSLDCISPRERQIKGLLFRLVFHSLDVSLWKASASNIRSLVIVGLI